MSSVVSPIAIEADRLLADGFAATLKMLRPDPVVGDDETVSHGAPDTGVHTQVPAFAATTSSAASPVDRLMRYVGVTVYTHFAGCVTVTI
jgi:hypothetical protein